MSLDFNLKLPYMKKKTKIGHLKTGKVCSSSKNKKIDKTGPMTTLVGSNAFQYCIILLYGTYQLPFWERHLTEKNTGYFNEILKKMEGLNTN